MYTNTSDVIESNHLSCWNEIMYDFNTLTMRKKMNIILTDILGIAKFYVFLCLMQKSTQSPKVKILRLK